MEFSLLAAFAFGTGWVQPVLVILLIAVLIWLLSGILFPARSAVQPNRSLQDLEGLDAQLARRLEKYGIRTDRDLMDLPPRGQQELESQLGLADGQYRRWRAQILERWKRAYLPEALREKPHVFPDPELGALYSQRPARCDDLTQLNGVDQLTANRMNAAGIYTFQQLRLLTAEQEANLRRQFKLTGFHAAAVPRRSLPQRLTKAREPLRVDRSQTPRSAEKRQPAAVSSGGSPAVSQSEGAATLTAVETKLDPELGELYLADPQSGDDLTQLAGVDQKIARRLNQGGIYTFQQLRRLTPTQQIQLRQRFGLKIDFADWREQLRESEPHAVVANHDNRTAITGSSDAGRQPAIPRSRFDPELGRLYTSPPPHRNDLTQLAGIDAVIAYQLNETGIYTFDQLQSLTPRQQTHLRQRFGLEGVDFSLWRGADLFPRRTRPPTVVSAAPSGEHAAAEPGPLSAAPVSREELVVASPHAESGPPVDDFTRLRGVDATLARRLHAMGLLSFEQLAAADVRQRAEIASCCGLSEVDLADWRRCVYAWNRGIVTVRESPRVFPVGWLYNVRLPEVAQEIFDGKHLVGYREQTIFRGSDPEAWGQERYSDPLSGTFSRSAPNIRSDINYVRIRRLDTRESVVTPVTKGQLFDAGPQQGNGWNGRCELFFGGRHLGIFAEEVPIEVELKFGLGGWGFGHRPHRNDQQEWSWQGRIIEPTKFEISVGHVGPQNVTTVFRSQDASIWNQHVLDHADRWAIPLASVNHPAHFVRLQRLDTDEAVIIRVPTNAILSRSDNPRMGWNGLNDDFFGGHHLGIFHRAVPRDVEVAFGAGGWGFGHPYNENDRQAFAWAGRAIPATCFEISVLESLPAYLEHELLE